jgi:hypothetical protein
MFQSGVHEGLTALMKTLLLFFAMLVSANVFAHTCHISLYDQYNRPYLNFYSTQDLNCQAAANQCYQTILSNRLNPNQYKCYTISITADQSQFQPQRPGFIEPDDREFLRVLERGETVYFKNHPWLVIYETSENTYELIPVGGKKNDIEKNVSRSDIAITRGCLRKICAKSSVYYTRAQKEMAVEGIGYNGKYVLKDVDSNAVFTDVIFGDIRQN